MGWERIMLLDGEQCLERTYAEGGICVCIWRGNIGVEMGDGETYMSNMSSYVCDATRIPSTDGLAVPRWGCLSNLSRRIRGFAESDRRGNSGVELGEGDMYMRSMRSYTKSSVGTDWLWKGLDVFRT